jgi:hypothetical protein
MATNVQAIASSFLRALGAPDTPMMRKAVEVWLRKEGISSVKRNNPWNLHGGAACKSASGYCPGGVNLPGAIGRANVGPGDQNVVVFATLDAGVRANAQNLIRLSNSGYGYDKVIKYARAGDPVAFLHALALSSWSAGRYGIRGGGKNSLITIWNSLTGRKDDPYGYKAIGKTPTGTIPKGTSSDGTTTDTDLSGRIKFGGRYAPSTNPIEVIADLFATLFDPRKWLLFLALIAGAGMTAWGGANVLRSAG